MVPPSTTDDGCGIESRVCVFLKRTTLPCSNCCAWSDSVPSSLDPLHVLAVHHDHLARSPILADRAERIHRLNNIVGDGIIDMIHRNSDRHAMAVSSTSAKKVQAVQHRHRNVRRKQIMTISIVNSPHRRLIKT